MKDEILRLEQGLKSKKEEMEQLKIEKGNLEASCLGQEASNTGLVVPCSVSGSHFLRVLQPRQGQPKRKRASKTPRDTLASLRREAGVLQVIHSTLLVLALCWCY